MREIARSGIMLDDSLANDYLQSVGQQLASQVTQDQPFHFFFVKDHTINAFALPGGYIGVHTGLFLETENEAELAGVLAHEIAHVTQRHIARRIEASREMSLRTLAMVLGAIAIGVSGAGSDVTHAAIATAQASAVQQQINFTRANEYEADRVGIGILAAAGFDPDGMVDFFEKMQRRARYIESRLPELLSTHPLSASRITEARLRARDYKIKPRPDNRLYALMKARIRVLTTNDVITLLEQFPEGAATPPTSQASMYGRALTLHKMGRADEAVPLFQTLSELQDDMVLYRIGLAEALIQAGRMTEALATYQEAAHLFPRNAPLTMSHAEALLLAGQADEAQRMMLELLTFVRAEPSHYRLLARIASAQGDVAESHFYLSEHYLLSGDAPLAMDQLKLALAALPAGSDSSTRRMRYEARLKEIQDSMRPADSGKEGSENDRYVRHAWDVNN